MDPDGLFAIVATKRLLPEPEANISQTRETLAYGFEGFFKTDFPGPILLRIRRAVLLFDQKQVFVVDVEVRVRQRLAYLHVVLGFR